MAVREIGTDIKLTGEKEFNDGMKSINSNLKTLRSDMAAVSATFEDNANSVEALTAKNKILQDSVDQQRVKVDALRQMYEKVAAASGENSAAADKWKQQLNNATVALAKEERALRQNNEALEAAAKAANAAEEPVKDLADASADVARTADRAADELDDMSDKAGKMSNVLPAVSQGLGSVASGAAQAAAAAAAVAAGFGVAAVTSLVTFAKESAEAAKAAQEAGETLTATQQAWLDYSNKLGTLDAASAKAKRALGGILLPQLSALSTEGASYLNNFAQSMEEAAGDTEKQAEVISEYMAKGAELILDNLPAYIQTGKTLLGGIKDGFIEMLPEIREYLREGAADFLSGLSEYGPQTIEKIVTGISEALPELGTAAGNIVGELIVFLTDPDTLSEVASAAWTIGEAIATAIWNGLKALFFQIADIPGLVEGINNLQQYQTTGTVGTMTIPGYADGLERVPYDNYLARLHKDEMVLTAAEANRYRNSGRGNGVTASVNVTFNAKTITPADVEMVVDVINEKLGDLIE